MSLGALPDSDFTSVEPSIPMDRWMRHVSTSIPAVANARSQASICR
ncbi:hypothetical protein LAUMK35_03231 [Mycobacterium pseudokansasii]|nr:hypothetical protein LAUMK35_03231 [Mycobacterium pseudokansasii]VAZ97452.1 hypothetical protein LAUMK21_03230 [Mycobacterium pseudokansasii]